MRHVSVDCCGATEQGHAKSIYVIKENGGRRSSCAMNAKQTFIFVPLIINLKEKKRLCFLYLMT